MAEATLPRTGGGGPPAAPAAAHEPFTGSVWVLMIITLSLTNFMEVLDISIANVSLNNIAGSLGVSVNETTWAITSYAVANAIAVPLAGWLGRRFGAVKVFTGAVIGFTIASWVCGMSGSLAMLITGRVIQGLFAGLMIPLSQALMLNNSPPAKRNMALAAWSMTVTVGPVVGPLLGGWITDNYHWSWIFYINIPAGILCSIAVWRLLGPRDNPAAKLPVDLPGILLLVLWVGSLQVMLDKGNELDWFESNTIIGLGLVALIGFVCFLTWEITEKNPIVDIQLFRFRNFRVGMIALCLGYCLFFTNVVLLPLIFQTQYGYTATWSGRITAPLGVGAVLFSPIVGRLMGKVDSRLLASCGFLIFAICSFWRTGYTTTSTMWMLTLPQFLQGVGIATFFAPLVNISTGAIPPERMASASGFQNFGRMMMGSFGASLGVTFWDHRAALHRTQMVEALPLSGDRLNDGLSALQQAGVSGEAAYAMIDRQLSIQAYVLAANDIFLLSGIIFVALMGVIWFARRPKPGGGGGH